jgi:hypothetical protein
MIFLVTGVSGSGKLACMPHLRRLLPQVVLYDVDAVGVPPHAGAVSRQQTTEIGRKRRWCIRQTPVKRSSVDVVRVDRLRACGTHGAT